MALPLSLSRRPPPPVCRPVVFCRKHRKASMAPQGLPESSCYPATKPAEAESEQQFRQSATASPQPPVRNLPTRCWHTTRHTTKLRESHDGFGALLVTHRPRTAVIIWGTEWSLFPSCARGRRPMATPRENCCPRTPHCISRLAWTLNSDCRSRGDCLR